MSDTMEILSISHSPALVHVGQVITVKAEVSNADSVQINIDDSGYGDMTYDSTEDEYAYSFPFTLGLIQSVWHGGWQTHIDSKVRAMTPLASPSGNLVDPTNVEVVYAYMDVNTGAFVSSNVNRTIVLYLTRGVYHLELTHVNDTGNDDCAVAAYETHPTLANPIPGTFLTHEGLTGYIHGPVDVDFDLEQDSWVAIKVTNTNRSDWEASLATVVLTKEADAIYEDYPITIQLNLDFIYDRTEEDLKRAAYLTAQVNAGTATEREYAQWLTDLKGMMNRSDFVRNCTNIYILSVFIGNEINTNNIPELPMPGYYNLFLGWVQTIRDSGFIRSTTPQVPQRPLNTIQKWNDIEQILYDVFSTVNTLRDTIWYCGEDAYAGGDIAVL